MEDARDIRVVLAGSGIARQIRQRPFCGTAIISDADRLARAVATGYKNNPRESPGPCVGPGKRRPNRALPDMDAASAPASSCGCGGSLAPGGRSRLHAGTTAAPIRTGEEPRSKEAQNWSTMVVTGRGPVRQADSGGDCCSRGYPESARRHGIVGRSSIAREDSAAGPPGAGSARTRSATWNSGT